jgi:ribosomal-protein-alanine N-acetyltransferase
MSAVERVGGRLVPVPQPEIEITRMRRRHLRKVLNIEGRVYPRPWSASLFLSELAQKTTRSYIVARYSGEVVGYAGLMFNLTDAHVTNIAVDPDLHGRRIGSKLLLTVVTEAIARGAETISLEVRVTNKIAQAMYAKFGFHITGMRRGYYIETREDAFVMEVPDARSTAFRERMAGIRSELAEYDGKAG